MSASCHGSPRRESTIASASHYFFDRDQHQFAGTVLKDKRSKDIIERLKPGSKLSEVKASDVKECLACHAPAANFAADHNEFKTLLSDGVGCESCHGASRHWLATHHNYEWKFPELWPATAKEQAGFHVTKDLLRRANVCADCHVGNENQKVSHDMIAAGHPRLTFEFAAYQAMMPAHWRRSDDRVRSQPLNGSTASDRSTHEARNWLIGQFVNAEHEVRILSSSVNRSSGSSPELAQYDCFGCHHELSSPSWRQIRKTWDLKPGEIEWGTWNLGLIPELKRSLPDLVSTQLIEHQRRLRLAMRSLVAKQTEILPLINALRDELRTSATEMSSVELTSQFLTAISQTLLDDYDTLTNQGWDRSAQLYLATVALEKSARDANGLGDRVNPDRKRIFLELRDHLSFRDKPDTRLTFDHRESPYRLEMNWATIRRDFELLRSSVSHPNPTTSIDQSAKHFFSILDD